MKIKRIEARNWLNKYNFDMVFNNDEDVEIITGPNAYGKSLLLTYIERISLGCRGYQNSLRHFDYLNIIYDDASTRCYVYNQDNKCIESTWDNKVDTLTVVWNNAYYKISNYSEFEISDELIDKFNKEMATHDMGPFRFNRTNNNEIRLLFGDSLVPYNMEDISAGQKQYAKLFATLMMSHCEHADIILADDIETNLHVVIQHKVIEIINKLKYPGSQFIMTTHSPCIIGSRWNICRDIYELDSRNKNNLIS